MAYKPISSDDLRDWEPGDGLICSHAKQAPVELPCGRPVKTSVRHHDHGDALPRTVVRPLCANHARIGLPPCDVLAHSRKLALEKLAAAHWDEYQEYLRAAIDRITCDADARSGQA